MLQAWILLFIQEQSRVVTGWFLKGVGRKDGNWRAPLPDQLHYPQLMLWNSRFKVPVPGSQFAEGTVSRSYFLNNISHSAHSSRMLGNLSCNKLLSDICQVNLGQLTCKSTATILLILLLSNLARSCPSRYPTDGKVLVGYGWVAETLWLVHTAWIIEMHLISCISISHQRRSILYSAIYDVYKLWTYSNNLLPGRIHNK
jgi:hypothetical protein